MRCNRNLFSNVNCVKRCSTFAYEAPGSFYNIIRYVVACLWIYRCASIASLISKMAKFMSKDSNNVGRNRIVRIGVLGSISIYRVKWI